jgi:hypothetical protein
MAILCCAAKNSLRGTNMFISYPTMITSRYTVHRKQYHYNLLCNSDDGIMDIMHLQKLVGYFEMLNIILSTVRACL